MKKIIMLFLTVSMLTNILMSKSNDNNVELAKVGNEIISYGELERAFQKNLNRQKTKISEIPKDSLVDFLNMYINYRLKVIDSKTNGYDKKTEVIKEIKDNRDILAESYFFDEYLYKPYINQMLKRRAIEKKIAIIMINYNEMSGVDSVKAWEKAQEVFNSLNDGVTFGDAAKKYSDDNVSSQNGGVINRWITAGTIDRGLEESIYATTEGKTYPYIVTSRKSFFIIKVVEEEERKLIKASHILLGKRSNLNTDSLANYIISTLKTNPERFEEFVKEYSDDVNTAKYGGSLVEYYSRSTGLGESRQPLLNEFQEGLFKLKAGEISGKVNTEYGIHIIRCDSIKTIDIAAETTDLRAMYRRLYFYKDKQLFLDSIALNYGYKINLDILTELLSKIDTTRTNLQSDWDIHLRKKLLDKSIFQINNIKYSVKELISLLNTKSEFKGFSINKEGFIAAIREIVHPIAFEIETKNYESKNEEFAKMVIEFKDGILLFKIEADKVWNNLKFDTLKAQTYYNKHKKEYKTDLNYNLSEIYVFDESNATSIYKQIAEDGRNFDSLATQKTQRAGKRKVAGYLGAVSTVKNQQAKLAHELNPKKGDILKPIKLKKGGYSIIRINDILPVRYKTFEEAIPNFAAKFQELQQKEMTEEWLEDIRKYTKVKINKKNINKIYK